MATVASSASPGAVDGTSPSCPQEQLAEVVDVRAARITARGRLGVRGAELLAATVGQLRRSGARSVVLDLALVTSAEPAALAVLAKVRREVAAAGPRLVLSGGPSPEVPAPSAVEPPVSAPAPGPGR